MSERASLANVVSVASAAVAAMAAAASVWLSWQGVATERAAQWSERRLEACEALDDAASEQIARAIEFGVAAANTPQERDELLSQMRVDADEFSAWAGDPRVCGPGNEGLNDRACRAWNEVVRSHAERRATAANIRFEASRRFRYLGPQALADTELSLSRSLAALSEDYFLNTDISQLTSISDPVSAARSSLADFRARCASTLDQFRR